MRRFYLVRDERVVAEGIVFADHIDHGCIECGACEHPSHAGDRRAVWIGDE